MLRNLFKTANRAKILFPFNSSLPRSLQYPIPKYLFSENKVPKGFEKFDRKKKLKEKLDEKKASEQKIEVEEKEEKKVEKKQEETFEEKLRKRIGYLFEEDKNKKDKEKDKKEEREEESIQDEKEDHKKKKDKQQESMWGFGGPGGQDKGKGIGPKFPSKLGMRHFILLGLVGFIFSQSIMEYYHDKDMISYTDFVKNYLENGKIDSITISMMLDQGQYRPHATLHISDGSKKALIIGNVDNFLESLEKYQLEKGIPADKLIPIQFLNTQDSQILLDRFISIVYIGALGALFYMMFKSVKTSMDVISKGGDMFGMSKSQVKIFGLDKKIKTKFKDVAGLDEAKVEIMEFVEFLKKPEKFNKIGAKIPRGALLSGPPGTGKTLLAKAAAGEAGVPFLSISGSDFVEMFVGVGASRVRDLFKKAKEHSPSIIFIDEIDAVGRKRESKMGNDEKDNTLNQLLVEMDGFGTDTNVIILAATNRKELLDPALTRPGRFDRSIEVSLPDIEGRKDIFMVHLKPIKLDPSKTMEEYAKRLATLTPGFSGADIANLCNEAAILAARRGKRFVTSDEFESASERVLAGLERKKIISEEERKIVAVHESGHAVISWFLEGGQPLLKLTIIPRSKGSLGFAQYLPNESSLESKQELVDRICCILGGRCSEELFNGKVTTGAYDDLQKAYEIAKNMVTKFGMSEKIGHVGLEDEQYVKRYSEEFGKEVDIEIKKIIDECAEITRKLVRQYKPQIEDLSKALLEKETLDLQSIINILGERPFSPKSNYKAYLEYKKVQDMEVEAAREAEKKEKESQDDNNNEGGDEGNKENKEEKANTSTV